MIYLLIALGGAAGSLTRFVLGTFVQTSTRPEFPYGTLVVNVLGCALIGLLAHALAGHVREAQLRALLVVGFCGGFTTFSSFSIEIVMLMRNGNWWGAIAYVTISVAAGIGATALAMGRPPAAS